MRRHAPVRGAREVALQISADECARVGGYDGVAVVEAVVDDGIELYAALADGFEREYGVVDGTEAAVGGEDHG